jgi:hypothetical protein
LGCKLAESDESIAGEEGRTTIQPDQAIEGAKNASKESGLSKENCCIKS